MRNFYIFLVAFVAVGSSAQDFRAFGGEYKFPEPTGPCVSPEMRQQMLRDISDARTTMHASGKWSTASRMGGHPMFIWPVVKAPSSPYNNVWSISNYMDHNAVYPNQLLDYNCGSRTYDTAAGYNHAGLDIYTWPFSWYQFQNNQSHAVAAADGIIIYKNDGLFDMSCAMSSAIWNAVYVGHPDGSVSVYGHLKKNSLTTKEVGDAVTTGEYLGVVGSSGNSTGPHLHFEVFDAQDELVDPYVGDCNDTTQTSWWEDQKEYYDPKLNAVLSHTAPPQFLPCPQTEIVNLSNDFGLGSSVLCAVYLADQMPGTSISLSLARPDGSIAAQWEYALTDLYSSSYWYWIFDSDFLNQSGAWTFTASYAGDTAAHQFTYVSLNVDENIAGYFSIYPNPTTDVLNITQTSDVQVSFVDLYDMVGKHVMRKRNTEIVDLSVLSDGIYLLEITSNAGKHKSKIVKK